MYEPKTDDTSIVDAAVTVDPAPTPVDIPPMPAGDFGIFNGSQITVENGTVTVLVPLSKGFNTTSVPVPLAAAWIIDNLAGAMLTEAKKHKP